MSPSTRSSEAGPSRSRSTRRAAGTSTLPPRDELESAIKETRPARSVTLTTSTTGALVTSPKITNTLKGKEKAQIPGDASLGTATPSSEVGRRVLPARLRRAAGGGQDGIRDLEEMIVDWLDRYGCPSDTPPDDLQITITSLPLSMDPPTYSIDSASTAEAVTVTSTAAGPSSSVPNLRSVIETPDWILVKAGQDDQEEAREELSTRMAASPVRRLRRLSIGEDHAEDTSDDHYIRLHKRYEAFEKRQRKDERDKLAFERYKMRTRIDLLKGMSVSAWSAVVWTVMARGDQAVYWRKGKDKVKVEGVDWLRRRLVKEGEEVMRRYDQLLPHDPKKARLLDSRNSTPSPSMGSASPPPAVIPPRVAALKDTGSTMQRRRSPYAHTNGDSSRRKRQISETHLSPPKRPARRASTAEASSGSDALSDPPPEHEDDEQSTRARTETPSETASPVSSTVSPIRKPLRKGTRVSLRHAAATKPVTRTSARLSQSQPNAPAGLEPSQAAATPNGHVSVAADDTLVPSDNDSAPIDSKSMNDPFEPYLPSSTLPQVDITPDEQLEMDRVEAAVVI